MTTIVGKVLREGEGLVRYSVPGETLYYKVTDEDTDGMLDYYVLDVDAKSGPPLHIHKKQHETVHFLKGRYKVQINDQTYYCDEGAFVHFPMGCVHAFLNLSDEPGKGIFTFSPGGTQRFFEEFGPAVRSNPDPANIAPIFARWGWELVGPPLTPD